MRSGEDRSRRNFLKSALLSTVPLAAPAVRASATPRTLGTAVARDDRAQWLAIVERVSQPVLEAISRQQLRATMPVEARP